MSKTLISMIAIAAIALTLVPSASATQCVTVNPALTYAVQTCNYVLTGGAANDAGATVAFATEEAGEAVAFVVATFGPHLP